MIHPARWLAGAALTLALAGAALAAPVTTATKDDMTLGSAKAPVTVIEYASASCPHCARFNNDVFPAFKAKYIDTGKVRYVLREFLTPPTDVAAAGFIAARCAGRDKYFTVVDTFFHSQQQMYQSGDVGSALIAAAKAGGVDETQLKAWTTRPRTPPWSRGCRPTKSATTSSPPPPS